MRLSCSPLMFFREMAIDRTLSVEEWFAIAADIGLAGSEMHYRCLRSLEPAYLAGVARCAQEHGLAISQFICAPDFGHPDPGIRAREVASFERHVEAAAALNAFSVRVTAGPARPDVSAQQAAEWVAECFRSRVEHARKHGIWLTYENHYKDFFWPEPDLSASQSVFLDILGRLADTDLKVNFDCSNSLMLGEDPLVLLGQVVPRVVHVHCSDRRALFEYTHAVPGEGLVDFPNIFRTLHQAGYDGWLSIEYNGPEGLDGVRRAKAYLERTWDAAVGDPTGAPA